MYQGDYNFVIVRNFFSHFPLPDGNVAIPCAARKDVTSRNLKYTWLSPHLEG
jgi:hypothetical protein